MINISGNKEQVKFCVELLSSKGWSQLLLYLDDHSVLMRPPTKEELGLVEGIMEDKDIEPYND